jgi:hypothetical protein
MPARYQNKDALLEAIHTARSQLEKKFSKLTPEQMVWPGSMDEWSVKDILAHLADWEQRFIGWYQAGVRGEVVHTPAPGMNWGDLAELNQQGYEKHLNETLHEVLDYYHRSYKQILTLIEGMSDDELFNVGYFQWTGKKPLENWVAANTSRHYNWARRNIRITVIRKAFAE